jgi:hypothetical protein
METKNERLEQEMVARDAEKQRQLEALEARLKPALAAAHELETTRERIDAAELRTRELERAHAAVEVQRDEAVALRMQLEARIAELRAASSASESELTSSLQVRRTP